MEQKIPKISESDIKRIIKRDFPKLEFVEILNILQMYNSNSEEGRNRIFASILKLSNGDFELIKMFVEKANFDFRDVIALSEYPNYSKYAFEEDLPQQKKNQLINEDWNQFEKWLKKTS
ncbi:MAG: hypothetical protein K2Q21_10590 [Chitinophagaceae bacterium]|nr:hypothetical protein [Chitinophagaceae bacterium]